METSLQSNFKTQNIPSIVYSLSTFNYQKRMCSFHNAPIRDALNASRSVLSDAACAAFRSHPSALCRNLLKIGDAAMFSFQPKHQSLCTRTCTLLQSDLRTVMCPIARSFCTLVSKNVPLDSVEPCLLFLQRLHCFLRV